MVMVGMPLTKTGLHELPSVIRTFRPPDLLAEMESAGHVMEPPCEGFTFLIHNPLYFYPDQHILGVFFLGNIGLKTSSLVVPRTWSAPSPALLCLRGPHKIVLPRPFQITKNRFFEHLFTQEG